MWDSYLPVYNYKYVTRTKVKKVKKYVRVHGKRRLRLVTVYRTKRVKKRIHGKTKWVKRRVRVLVRYRVKVQNGIKYTYVWK